MFRRCTLAALVLGLAAAAADRPPVAGDRPRIGIDEWSDPPPGLPPYRPLPARVDEDLGGPVEQVLAPRPPAARPPAVRQAPPPAPAAYRTQRPPPGVGAARPFRDGDINPSHTCPKCGTTSPAGTGTWLIRARNPDGTHTHACPNCGAWWRH